MMKKSALKYLALPLCILLLLAGCGGSGGKTADSDKKGASAKKDELRIAISANPPSLDAQIANSNITAQVGYHIFEPLFAMDENFEPQAVLADSYEVSEDGKEYTIKLLKGVKFHNGKEMTADDVVASLNRWVKDSQKASTLIGGSKFEKVDDYTVKMTANEAASDIITVLANPIMFAAIYPAEVVEEAGEKGISEYIGTGPYKLTKWKQDQFIQLDKFDDYKVRENATTGLAGKKTAATKTLTFEIVTDASTRIAGAKNGQYDIVEEIPQDNYEELEKASNLKLDVTKGGTLNLFLNTTVGIMEKQEMRQAILAALNMDDILLASYGNKKLYEVNPGWFDPEDKQWGSDAGKEYYNQNDSEKSKELLKKAGYNNEKLVMVTTQDYPEMYNATLVVQEQLKKVGINAEVESYDFSTFMEHRADPNQNSMFITSNAYNVFPIQLTVLDKTWAGMDRPEVTDGIKAMRFADSQEDAKAAWDDLQGYIYEYGGATVLGHFTGVNTVSNDVNGYEYMRFPIFWNATVSK
ncbi:ABC transporter substrate-binding protein [Listeria sp. FSL L7-0091]|uniref:ABC transporter substrate-binding protein n=1 Tax=Listeria TaxID=1637 RepID=UPI00162528B8|nr:MULTISPECIES: ABC transporter substrate-binding protein [Listeria]EBF5117083.1 ABC transporter substrate-binding protein [Listeria monocytogenes]EBF5125948.1 ABC transporter substrate-binding protein [Listeria monocytogenes]EBF5152302.1 ABC transporter substrate-binding protein [Listeria monocytogenes]MBC2137467.1 ABC transporter substrate-binding protein [Listeria innocua]MBC2262540.1 ABC transporter substrate-binding protein [Listeria farberi]